MTPTPLFLSPSVAGCWLAQPSSNNEVKEQAVRLPTAAELEDQAKPLLAKITPTSEPAEDAAILQNVRALYQAAMAQYLDQGTLTIDQRLELARICVSYASILAGQPAALSAIITPFGVFGVISIPQQPLAALEAAVDQYEKALGNMPPKAAKKYYEAFVEYGQLLLSMERLDEARRVFERAREVNRPALSPAAEVGLGQLALITQSWHKAISHFEAARRAASNKIWSPSNQEQAEILDHLAVAYRYQGGKGSLDRAMGLERQAVAADPDNLTALHNLACLLVLQGKLQEADQKLFLLVVKAEAAGELEEYAKSIANDDDLAPYRATPDYETLKLYITKTLQSPRVEQKL